MRIDVGRLVIEADSAGRITSVAPTPAARAPPSSPPWRSEPADATAPTSAGPSRRGGDRRRRDRPAPASPPGWRSRLRHSFSTGWTTRLLIVNTGSADALLDRISLIVRPAAGHRVSAQAAGSRLCWAVQPVDGEGPLLAARLAAGAVDRVTDEALELGPLRLAAGQRYVAQLRWELFATPRSVVIGPGRDVAGRADHVRGGGDGAAARRSRRRTGDPARSRRRPGRGGGARGSRGVRRRARAAPRRAAVGRR